MGTDMTTRLYPLDLVLGMGMNIFYGMRMG